MGTIHNPTTPLEKLHENVEEIVMHVTDFFSPEDGWAIREDVRNVICATAFNIFDGILPNATKRGKFKAKMKMLAVTNPAKYTKEDLKLAKKIVNLHCIEGDGVDYSVQEAKDSLMDKHDQLIIEASEENIYTKFDVIQEEKNENPFTKT